MNFNVNISDESSALEFNFYNLDIIGQIFVGKSIIVWILVILTIGVPFCILWCKLTIDAFADEEKTTFAFVVTFATFTMIWVIGAVYLLFVLELGFFSLIAPSIAAFTSEFRLYGNGYSTFVSKKLLNFIALNKSMYRNETKNVLTQCPQPITETSISNYKYHKNKLNNIENINNNSGAGDSRPSSTLRQIKIEDYERYYENSDIIWFRCQFCQSFYRWNSQNDTRESFTQDYVGCLRCNFVLCKKCFDDACRPNMNSYSVIDSNDDASATVPHTTDVIINADASAVLDSADVDPNESTKTGKHLSDIKLNDLKEYANKLYLLSPYFRLLFVNYASISTKLFDRPHSKKKFREEEKKRNKAITDAYAYAVAAQNDDNGNGNDGSYNILTHELKYYLYLKKDLIAEWNNIINNDDFDKLRHNKQLTLQDVFSIDNIQDTQKQNKHGRHAHRSKHNMELYINVNDTEDEFEATEENGQEEEEEKKCGYFLKCMWDELKRIWNGIEEVRGSSNVVYWYYTRHTLTYDNKLWVIYFRFLLFFLLPCYVISHLYTLFLPLIAFCKHIKLMSKSAAISDHEFEFELKFVLFLTGMYALSIVLCIISLIKAWNNVCKWNMNLWPWIGINEMSNSCLDRIGNVSFGIIIQKLNLIDYYYKQFCLNSYYNIKVNEIVDQCFGPDITSIIITYLPLENLESIFESLLRDSKPLCLKHRLK